MNEILVVKIPVKKKGESVHMKKVVAMYEQEEAYGKNLAEYVNRKENMPFELQVFSQADKLSDYLQGHTPQLLLLSEESSLESYGEMSVSTPNTTTSSGLHSRHSAAIWARIVSHPVPISVAPMIRL